MRLLIALVVWIGAVAAAVAVSSTVADSIHAKPAAAVSGGSGASGSNPTQPAGGPPDPSTIKPMDPLSLFRTANLTRALATVRAHVGAGARIDNFALYPGYLAMTQVRGASEVEVYIDADGRYSTTNTGGSPGGLPVFPLSLVSATVPAALAQRIATSGHVAESELGYFVAEVDPVRNTFRWLVYPKQGNRVEYFQAAGATGQLLEYLAGSSTGLQPVR